MIMTQAIDILLNEYFQIAKKQWVRINKKYEVVSIFLILPLN